MLEVRNLVKIYKTKKAADVRALDDVSIKFNDTGMVFLLGKSGSGKSTLLNVMGGLDKFDGGEIIIKGKSSRSFSEKDFDAYRNTFLGFIFQEYNVLPEFTVQKNISLALELQGKKADKKAVDELLEQVDLSGYAKRKPNQLSGGQKQRIAIARALIKSPQIIMADEPTGALDSATGKQVFETLKKLSKEKLVIVVSHDREFAEIYADRIIEMKDGKVISDVTKRQKPPKAISSGFKIVGKNMVHIQKNHRFTADEAQFLNKIVQGNTNDIFISADSDINSEIKKIARIDDDGNSEFFDNTTSADIIENKEFNSLNLINSKLRYKDSFKMGASGLKSKKFRLVLTILLSAISLALFGLADTMASFNVARSNFDSLKNLNTDVISISKEYLYDGGDYKYTNEGNATDGDIKTLKEKFPDYEFKPGYEINYGINDNFKNKINESDMMSMDSIRTGFELTSDELAKYNLELYPNSTISRLPNNESEVVITKYQFEIFKKYGYKDYGGGTERSVNSPTDIIGQNLNLWNSLKIVGIIDTHFDTSRYELLANVNGGANEMNVWQLQSELESLLNHGFHNAIFTYPGVLKDLCEYRHFNRSYESYECYAYVGTSPSSTNYYNLGTNTAIASSIMISDSKTSLNDDEVIVGASLQYAEGSNFKDLYMTSFTSGYERCWLMNLREYTNKEEFVEALAVKVRNILNNGITVNINHQNTGKVTTFKVAGVYFEGISSDHFDDWTDYNYVQEDNNIYFKNEDCMPVGIRGMFGDYTTIITKMLDNDKSDFELVEYLSNYGAERDVLLIQSEVTGTIENFHGVIEVLAEVFLYVGIGFAVFSALLLMNFITISISYKKKEIGILRALGARGSDVYGIFFNESLIITFINYILSLVLTCGTVIIINTVMRTKLGFYLTLLSFGIRQVILLALVSLAVAVIASFLPTHKISKMKPIDAIHDRK